jgi:hypothetical protein
MAVSIRYRKPAKGTVRAEFRLSAEQIDEVRKEPGPQAKVEPGFVVQIKSLHNEVMAEAGRTLNLITYWTSAILASKSPG